MALSPIFDPRIFEENSFLTRTAKPMQQIGDAAGRVVRRQRDKKAAQMLEDFAAGKLDIEGETKYDKLVGLQGRLSALSPEAASAVQRQAEQLKGHEQRIVELGGVPEALPLQNRIKFLQEDAKRLEGLMKSASTNKLLIGESGKFRSMLSERNKQISDAHRQLNEVLGAKDIEEPRVDSVEPQEGDGINLEDVSLSISMIKDQGELKGLREEVLASNLSNGEKSLVVEEIDKHNDLLVERGTKEFDSVYKKGMADEKFMREALGRDADKAAAVAQEFKGLAENFSAAPPVRFADAKARVQAVSQALKRSLGSESYAEGLESIVNGFFNLNQQEYTPESYKTIMESMHNAASSAIASVNNRIDREIKANEASLGDNPQTLQSTTARLNAYKVAPLPLGWGKGIESTYSAGGVTGGGEKKSQGLQTLTGGL